jgi:2-C-methyl-D-erythritol 4-phosphate cytidylyltransferase
MKKKVSAIILAAGKGSRMKSNIKKQFMVLDKYPVIYYSLKAFNESPVDNIVLVTDKDSVEYCANDIVKKYGFDKVTDIVEGGAERYASVYNGLKAICDCDIVMIHDGARPFVTQTMIEDSIKTMSDYKACTVGVPVKDTIKLVDDSNMGIETPPRDRLWQIQTPQTFDYKLLCRCYEKMMTGETNVTDDTMVVERYGNCQTKVIFGDYTNIKITTPEDMEIGEKMAKNLTKKVLQKK